MLRRRAAPEAAVTGRPDPCRAAVTLRGRKEATGDRSSVRHRTNTRTAFFSLVLHTSHLGILSMRGLPLCPPFLSCASCLSWTAADARRSDKLGHIAVVTLLP
ncbi:hypothetical protein MRX96_026952 [Rhipicephalus microplus]